MSRDPRLVSLLTAAVLCGGLVSCQREQRQFRPAPNTAQTVSWVRVTDLEPGGPAIDSSPDVVQPAPDVYKQNYKDKAYEISEGKKLFEEYNCYGCHAFGGGDIGPALMDDKWSYGSQPAQIFATIVQGRPNGMPAFGRRLPEHQIWQLVAYVESLSGQASSNAAPGRVDDMSFPPPENSREKESPKDSGLPPSGERPE